MTGPTSYWLPDGQMIFPYDTDSRSVPPWIIVKRGNRMRTEFTMEEGGTNSFTRFREGRLGNRFKTEEEARAALHRYAREHGLRPAY